MPTFGSQIAGIVYYDRPAAYAVIKGDASTVAVVPTRRGYFLPGGGSLPGEPPETTIEREVREELARSVRILWRIGEAVQYFFADDRHYRMQAVFFAAEFVGPTLGSGEYQLHWVTVHELKAAAFHASHVWAAQQVSLEG